MSLEQFITKLLNLKESDLQDLVSLEKPDDSIEFKLKLKPKPTVCPLCGSVVKIHGYYSRKLTHSTFANRKCTILYQQRRYRCEACELTFHEPNPFINSSECLTYETKLNKTCSIQDAPEAIDNAISTFANAGIKEFEPFYRMLSNWRTEIINSFTTINGIRINNSYIESKNKILEKLLYNGNGFSNFKRTRNRILYCLNKNDTYKF